MRGYTGDATSDVPDCGPANPGWPGYPETVEEARAHPEKLAGVREIADHVLGWLRSHGL